MFSLIYAITLHVYISIVVRFYSSPLNFLRFLWFKLITWRDGVQPRSVYFNHLGSLLLAEDYFWVFPFMLNTNISSNLLSFESIWLVFMVIILNSLLPGDDYFWAFPFMSNTNISFNLFSFESIWLVFVVIILNSVLLAEDYFWAFPFKSNTNTSFNMLSFQSKIWLYQRVDERLN